MKMNRILLSIILFFAPITVWSTPVYNEYFTNDVLRFDYLLTGDHLTEKIMPCEIKKEKQWSGSHRALIDLTNNGTYRFEVFDKEDNTLIFSKGFAPLFQEWQTTPEATTVNKGFYQVIRFPFPKNSVLLNIEKRDTTGLFKSIFSTTIDPDNYFIIDENAPKIAVNNILYQGDPIHKIDIAILAEGYTRDEMEKFQNDAKRLTDSLFMAKPFNEMRSYFNVYALETPSMESGTDIPGENIFRNTLFNSTFYTFDVARYLTTTDMKTICNMATVVPYDQIYILVNSARYGGGGFYNFINVCTADNQLSSKVFIHEFGHGFGGLGDEYYTSEVAYDNYYNLNIEPWEPNLTTLVNFESKWKGMVSKSTPIPTPRTEEYSNTIGAFEGGGYVSKGVYSPMQDCRMKSNEAPQFCPVCRKAIKEAILENTK